MLTLRKRGRFWHARGTVPMRQADGKIAWVRIEESTREVSKARAIRAAQDLADYYRELAYRPAARSVTFTEAAITYVESKSPSKRDREFIAKLIAHFGETPIGEMDQAAIAAAAHKLYPECAPSTHNRAVFAPAIAILRLSGLRPDIRRPKIQKAPPRVPHDGWFDALLPHCSPELAALIVFLTLTGRRIGEALQAIDNGDGTATIGKTKTGSPVVVAIPGLCRKLLGKAERGNRLFYYADRWSVRNALKAACKRAKVDYYGTHSLGRHAFATRLLKEGWSVKHVAAAGGWASPRLVLERYGHLERSEIADAVKKLGQQWGRKRKIARKSQKSGI